MAEYKVDGVVAILTAPDGRVLATASDFERSGYGGFKLHEAQRIRARDAMRGQFFRNSCNPDVAKAIGAYHADSILREICNQHKYKEQFILIGHAGIDREYDYVVERKDD